MNFKDLSILLFVLKAVQGNGRLSELDLIAVNFAKPIKDRKLTGSVIKEAEVTTVKTACKIECVKDERCVSYNLVPIQGKKTWTCQLSKSDRFVGHENFTEENGTIYRGIQSACEKGLVSCEKNEVCVADYRSSTDNYLCKCLNECPQSCHDHFLRGSKSNGLYRIYFENGDPFQVFCDMTTGGGGWTVFQRRMDGSVDFYLGWASYRAGFGTLSSKFWLGNDNIHRLTAKENMMLRVDMEDFSSVRKYAEYSTFAVANASDNYRLTIDGYQGTAGDSMVSCPRPAKNMMFSTKDRDNDVGPNYQCAVTYTGSWWYHHCLCANPNGLYKGGGHAQGVVWQSFKGLDESLKLIEMKFRPKET